MPTFASPLSTETLLTIRLETWRRFFSAHGAPAGVRADAPSIAEIDEALVLRPVSERLFHPLAFVEAFAPDRAREALYEAARVFDYRTSWRDYASPADLAAGCSAEAPTDERLRLVLAAARARVCRGFPFRSWFPFLGRARLEIGDPSQYVEALEKLARPWAASTDRGPLVLVRAAGSLRKARFELVHEDRASGAPILADVAWSLGVTRPVRSHLATFDGERLYVWTAVPEIVLAIVEMFATVFANDKNWFFSRGAVSTLPLQRASEGGKLPKLGTTFSSVAFIGGTWDSGSGYSISPRGRDAYEALDAEGVSIDGGAVRLATLRGFTAPGVDGPPSADFSLRPPYTATCSEPALAAPFLRYADAFGLTDPEQSRGDWFGFEPYRHDAAGWSALPDADALVRLGVIREDAEPAPRIAHPSHRHAGPVASVFALPGGWKYGLSDDPIFSAFLVDDAQLVTSTLHFGALGALLAEALGLTGGSATLDEDGFLFVGVRLLGPTTVRVYLPTRASSAAAIERLRREAAPGHAVVLLPEGRTLGLAHVALRTLAPPYRSLLGDIVRALGLVDAVAPILYAPADARIVLQAKNTVVYVDGVHITHASVAVARLLEYLAQNLGQSVTSRSIKAYVSPKSTDDAVARKTIEAFVLAVNKSFRDAKKKPPKDLDAFIVQARHGEYRLAVTIFSI